jgi:hypothetical protein
VAEASSLASTDEETLPFVKSNRNENYYTKTGIGEIPKRSK